MMQDGFLTIRTTVDGTESRFSCKAEMEFTSLSAVLRYVEENAQVTITVNESGATIERRGDYSMRLSLRERERTQGVLSIGGNEGSIDVETERIAYSLNKKSLLLQLHYTLHFGSERQRMRLMIKATIH